MSENNLHNDDHLKQEAPFLFGIKKEEPFDAPDGYFEKFQAELQDKIHSKKSSWWNVLLKPIVWAPAMIILIVSSLFLLKGDESVATKTTATTNEKLKLNELSYDVLDAYVNDHLLAQVNTDEIMEMVGAENIPSLGNSEISKNESEITPTIEHVEENEMEEYIMENIEDIEIY